MGLIIQLRPVKTETEPVKPLFRRPLPHDDDAPQIQRVRESLEKIRTLFDKLKGEGSNNGKMS